MEQIKKIMLAIHEIGGCDASDDYSKGYDDGITAALSKITEVTGVSIEDVLE